MPVLLDARTNDPAEALARIRHRLSIDGSVVSEAGRKKTLEVFGEELSPQQVVERICNEVRDEGIAAVLRYSRALDGADLAPEEIRTPDQALAEAHASADPELLQAVREVRDNILEFQQPLTPRETKIIRPGVVLRQRYTPLNRVGVCVPGGAAAYPSSVLMTVVPAQAAGVREIALIAPPTSLGAYNQDVLAVAHELGVREVYRVGGAQGVAALAYGVSRMPPVDKIVGPGNLFVALAKKRVYGEVDIDSIAGPSEVVVLADGSSSPEFVAADLLAQAEHAPGASFLITWSMELLDAVRRALEVQCAELTRGDAARQSLDEFGALILARDSLQACELANQLAPEHLHIATDDAELLLPRVPCAGAVFLGPYSPVAVGDYVAGPSHVLPTSGTARWASGLSARDFIRGGSVIHYDRSALERAAPALRVLADREGLTAHRASVDRRLAGDA